MHKSFKKKLELYCNSAVLEYSGHLAKYACRINDNTPQFDDMWQKSINYSEKKTLQDSMYFKELFAESSKGDDCYYVTALDDIIKTSHEQYIPIFVPCFMKKVRNTTSIASEIAGSRLANALGVKTVFNVPINSEDKPTSALDLHSVKGCDYVASVDFVKSGEKFFTMHDLNIKFDLADKLEDIIYKLKKLKKKLKYKGVSIKDEDIENIANEICEQWFFKCAICLDMDFGSSNEGIVLHGKNGASLSPCYDMEFFFANNDFLDCSKNGVVDFENIMYFFKRCPDRAERIMTKLNNLNNTGILEDIMSVMSCSKKFLEMSRDFGVRISMLNNVWAYACKEMGYGSKNL